MGWLLVIQYAQSNHLFSSLAFGFRGAEMGDIEERMERGIACKVEGRYEEAIAELKAVLCIDDCHCGAHRQLGLVYGFTGMFDESIEELKRAAELDPQNLEVMNDLAMSYAMLGMYDEAKSGFLAVLELDPSNDTARKQLAYF
jgi:tetratricopeptide (TPR) repeat protein